MLVNPTSNRVEVRTMKIKRSDVLHTRQSFYDEKMTQDADVKGVKAQTVDDWAIS